MQASLLIASPQMRDPWFEGTVVLLCHHDGDGAFGLVINRPDRITLGQVTDSLDLPLADRHDEPTWWGGPVNRDSGFVVFEGEAPQDEGWTLAGRVAVSASISCMTELVKDDREFALCLGYAGWGPAQLDSEIERGSWIVADLDAELVLNAPLEDRYARALASLGLTAQTVWMQPVDE